MGGYVFAVLGGILMGVQLGGEFHNTLVGFIVGIGVWLLLSAIVTYVFLRSDNDE